MDKQGRYIVQVQGWVKGVRAALDASDQIVKLDDHSRPYMRNSDSELVQASKDAVGRAVWSWAKENFPLYPDAKIEHLIDPRRWDRNFTILEQYEAIVAEIKAEAEEVTTAHIERELLSWNHRDGSILQGNGRMILGFHLDQSYGHTYMRGSDREKLSAMAHVVAELTETEPVDLVGAVRFAMDTKETWSKIEFVNQPIQAIRFYKNGRCDLWVQDDVLAAKIMDRVHPKRANDLDDQMRDHHSWKWVMVSAMKFVENAEGERKMVRSTSPYQKCAACGLVRRNQFRSLAMLTIQANPVYRASRDNRKKDIFSYQPSRTRYGKSPEEKYDKSPEARQRNLDRHSIWWPWSGMEGRS